MEIRGTFSNAHDDKINCYTFFGTRFVTGGSDGAIKIWDYDTITLLKTLKSMHTAPVTGLACTPSKTLFSGSSDGTIVSWVFNSEIKAQYREKLGLPISCLVYEPVHKLIYATGKDTIYEYKILEDSFKLNNKFVHHHSDYIMCMTAGSGRIITGGMDRVINITEPLTGRKIFVLKGHTGGVSALALDTSTETLYSGSYDQTVKVWGKDGALLYEIKGISDTISGIAFNPLSQSLWVCANTTFPLIFESSSGINITENMWCQPTANNKRLFRKVFFLPKQRELFFFTTTNEILVFRWSKTAAITTLNNENCSVDSLTYCSATGMFYSGGSDGNIRMYESVSAQRTYPLYTQRTLTPHAHSGSVSALVWEDSVRTLVSAGHDALVRMWDQEDSLTQPTFSPEDDDSESSSNAIIDTLSDFSVRSTAFRPPHTLIEHKGQVDVLCVCSHNGNSAVLSASKDMSLCAWAWIGRNPQLLWKIEDSHSGQINSIAWDAQRGMFATCCVEETRICIWTFAQHKVLCWLSGHSTEVTHLVSFRAHSTINNTNNSSNTNAIQNTDKSSSFDLNSDANANTDVIKNTAVWGSASRDGTVILWNEDGTRKTTILCGNEITALCVDELMSFIIVATNDRILRVYDQTGNFLNSYKGHTDTINSIIHVVERGVYITGSWDKTIKIWNAHSFLLRNEESMKDVVQKTDEQFRAEEFRKIEVPNKHEKQKESKSDNVISTITSSKLCATLSVKEQTVPSLYSPQKDPLLKMQPMSRKKGNTSLSEKLQKMTEDSEKKDREFIEHISSQENQK